MSIKDLRDCTKEIITELGILNFEMIEIQKELLQYSQKLDYKNEVKMKFDDAISRAEQVKNTIMGNVESLKILSRTPPGFMSLLLDFVHQSVTGKFGPTEKENYQKQLQKFDAAVARQSVFTVERSFGLPQESFTSVADKIVSKIDYLTEADKVSLLINLENIISGIFQEVDPEKIGGDIKKASAEMSEILVERKGQEAAGFFNKINSELYELLKQRMTGKTQEKIFLNYLDKGIQEVQFKPPQQKSEEKEQQKTAQMQDIQSDLEEWIKRIKARKARLQHYIQQVQSKTSDIKTKEVNLGLKYYNYFNDFLGEHQNLGLQKLLINLEHSLSRILATFSPQKEQSIDTERNKEQPVEEMTDEQEATQVSETKAN